jgi:serine/threonine protein kinase
MNDTPRAIGPFEVLRKLSEGPVGEVFVCRRTGGTARDAVPVVLKTFNPALVEKRAEIEKLERAIHRCIIQYKHIGYDSERARYYTVMDRLQVQPHTPQLTREAKLGFREKVRRFQEIGDGLAALHAMKGLDGKPLWHGALKPSNLIVRRALQEYHIIVTDFGFSYKWDAAAYREHDAFFNAWVYMAPEVILAAKPDLWPKHGPPPPPCAASDVYSWTLLLVSTLNDGRDGFYRQLGKPSEGDRVDDRVRGDIAVLYEKKIAVHDQWSLVVGDESDVDKEKFKDFVLHCLAPDPRDRPETMEAAVAGFKECML